MYINTNYVLGFIQPEHLTFHVRTEHTYEKPFECHDCGKTFPVKVRLKYHIISKHSSPQIDSEDSKEGVGEKESVTAQEVMCNVNGKVCSNSSNYVHHHRTNSSFWKKYLCSICGKGFNAKNVLEHHAAVHSDEKKFSCQFCDKKYKQYAGLYSHIANVHSNKEPLQCPTCGKLFSSAYNLRCHQNIHNGIKPYSCKVCGESFRHRTTLTDHFTRSHSNNFSCFCDLCGKGFSFMSKLKTHMKVSHKKCSK